MARAMKLTRKNGVVRLAPGIENDVFVLGDSESYKLGESARQNKG